MYGMLNWLRPRKERISGRVVDLVVDQKIDAAPSNQQVPSVLYRIVLHGTDQTVGTCDLRIGMNEELYYAGNIGYNIRPAWRGHGYAYHACRVLLRIARQEYDMQELLITCSPDNIASRRTLEKLQGELVETADVPRSHWLYERGETVKNIYRFQLL